MAAQGVCALHKGLEDHLRYCQKLPSLSTVALWVIDLANNPSADFGDVARCIGLDPALAAKVLRVANSPLYGKRRNSDNLRQALTQLGLDNTVSLALGFSLMSSLRATEQGFLDRKHYWHRAILCAIAARALGQFVKVPQLEELFLGGLLQDIGMLILDSVMEERYGEVANGRDHAELVAVEREALATDHIEVGAWVMKHWQLPEYLRSFTLCSHDPEAADLPRDRVTMTRCVHVSGQLADCWLFDNSEVHTIRASNSCRQWLGMDDDVFHGVMEAIASELPSVAAQMDIPVLTSVQIAGILEQAKEILLARTLQLITEVRDVKSDADALKCRTRALETQASMDRLTGLFNRSGLEERLASEFALATEQRMPLSIAFIDLDRFKQVNDTYGHLVGDEVLQSTAGVLAANLRQTDFIARYGGEEFVVILPGADAQAARLLTERLLVALRSHGGASSTVKSIRVTASIGLVTYTADATEFADAVDLLRAADRALYAAKHRGRDKVVIYG